MQSIAGLEPATSLSNEFKSYHCTALAIQDAFLTLNFQMQSSMAIQRGRVSHQVLPGHVNDKSLVVCIIERVSHQ